MTVAAPGIASAAAPLSPRERIPQLDALRGVALLGLLLANVRQMFLPWHVGSFAVDGGSDVGKLVAWVDWGFFDAVVDLKFMTLFSLVFGMGFALQRERLAGPDAGFGRVFLRRIAILAAIGLAHGLLLYPAETLLPYAAAGLLLYTVRDWPADRLYRVGLVLVGWTITWGFQIGALGHVEPAASIATLVVLAAIAATIWPHGWRYTLAAMALAIVAAMLLLVLGTDRSGWGEPASAAGARAHAAYLSMQASDPAAWPREFQVRREGQLADLLDLHRQQYARTLAEFALVIAWRTLGLFMIGVALARSGVLVRASAATWRRVSWIGLGIGLPASIVATLLHGRDIAGLSDLRWPEWLHVFSAFPLAIGFGARVLLAEQLGRRQWWYSRMKAAGRMAISNYLAQSLVLAILAEPWGFGLYGRLTGPQLTATAFVVFFALANLSHHWLQSHAFGPVEWLWRCGTYRRWLPNRADVAQPG